ncbi:aminotransferase class I/II-fold pyridoxal phosphate-dependent enzyme [Pseudonocardia sp. ICBG1122]|nr:aminotransferase class I/II-fold pyridoxal phosphate-dependent enzyme [Pseudonocardia pini]
MTAPRTVTAEDPVVADHRIDGVGVLPAAAQIDLMLQAVGAGRSSRRWWLEHVVLAEPLTVGDGGVELGVDVADDGALALRSRPAADPVAPARLHARAVAAGAPLPPPTYLDTAAMEASAGPETPLSVLDGWRATSGIAYGERYRVIRSLRRDGDRLFGVLRPAAAEPGAVVDPAVLDAVLQGLGLLDDGATGPCLPWYIGRVTVRRPVRGTLLALVERTPGGPDAAGCRGRATVCTEQGEVVLELDRIVLRAVPGGPDRPAVPRPRPATGSAPGRPPGATTVPGWRASTAPSPAPSTPPRTLVLGEVPGPAEPAGRLGPDAVADGTLRSRLADDPPGLVVYAPAGGGDPSAVVQQAAALVRVLATARPFPALTVLTRDAHGVRPDPAHTALWGLFRSVRTEHPRTPVTLVDLDTSAPTAPPTVPYDGGEHRFRDGTHLVPHASPAGPAEGPPFEPRGQRVLVTGGLTGLGLLTAERLAALGCAHLTLVGRTPPAGGRAARVDRLRGRCEIRVLTTDVTDPDPALGRDRFDLVVHAAGVLRDGLARTLTPERIAQVLAPKISGVQALDALFDSDHRPGAVVLFGSISAVRGNLGQSAYAAANAFLDGYAARRRSDGERWWSLDWGLWNAGMGEDVVAAAAARGIPALEPDTGLALLSEALGRPPGQYVLSAPARPKDEPMTSTLGTTEAWTSVSSILTSTMHLPAVTPGDDLLELGLDSMMAVEITAGLAKAGYEVDPALLFELTRVQDLLDHLGPRPAATATPLAPPAPVATPAPATTPAPVATPTAGGGPSPVSAAGGPVPAPTGGPVPRAERSATPDPATFRPDWDRFRTGPDGSAAPSPAVAVPGPSVPVQAAVLPPAAVPVSPAGGPPPGSVPGPRPAGTHTLPEPAAPARRPEPATLPATPAGIPGRTLPGRLTDRPSGGFLDRRIDDLSREDRAVVAEGRYFYEPVVEEETGSWIRFDGRWYLNFASYSYLGLIGHDYIGARVQEAVRRHGTGAHGVRLLAGTLDLHRELELAIARFLGTEDAIVYSSGYMANVATVGALVGPGDTVIGDVYNHASILDGYRLSGARVVTYAHNDLDDLERALRRTGDGGRLVVTDAVFSMDGDLAPLPGIVELCERHDAPLMVDEAHSLGVLGRTGRGITEHFGIAPERVAIKMGTLSKTVPSAGGYVAGSADLVFALKNNARGWMFSAAVTPANAAAALAAVEVMTAAPGMAEQLRRRTGRYRDALHRLGFDTLNSESPVVPVLCRDDAQAQDLARLCQADGVFVQPIVYPAVPRSLPRLRTIVNLSHTDDDIDLAVEVLARAGRRLGLV